jgi:hypothetical protein
MKKKCIHTNHMITLDRSKYVWCTKCGVLGYEDNRRYRWRYPGTNIVDLNKKKFKK